MTLMADVTEVDGYAVVPPAGEWSYVIDSTGISYRRGLVPQKLRRGHWPFAYADPDDEQRERHGDYPPVAPECGVAVLRLAPDTAYYAWRNEYVVIGPDRAVPHLAHASVTLWAGERRTLPGRIHLDLRAGTYELDGVPDDAPAEVRAQAEMKGAKLTAFLAAACAERDTDKPAPATASDLEDARSAERAAKLSAWCDENGLAFRPVEGTLGEYFYVGVERLHIVTASVRFGLNLFGNQPERAA